MNMKMTLVLALVAGFGLIYLWDQGYVSLPQGEKTQQQVYRPAPQIPFKTLEGDIYHSFADLPEPTVLVHFWASWCKPCIKEFPVLLRRIEDADGKLGLVAISVDNQEVDMRNFITQVGRKVGILVDNPHVYWVSDPGKVITETTFGTYKLPETIVLDANRNMVKKFVGETDWFRAKL